MSLDGHTIVVPVPDELVEKPVLVAFVLVGVALNATLCPITHVIVALFVPVGLDTIMAPLLMELGLKVNVPDPPFLFIVIVAVLGFGQAAPPVQV